MKRDRMNSLIDELADLESLKANHDALVRQRDGINAAIVDTERRMLVVEGRVQKAAEDCQIDPTQIRQMLSRNERNLASMLNARLEKRADGARNVAAAAARAAQSSDDERVAKPGDEDALE